MNIYSNKSNDIIYAKRDDGKYIVSIEGDFFELSEQDFNETLLGEFFCFEKKVRNAKGLLVGMILTIIFSLLLFFYRSPYEFVGDNFKFSILLLVINIFIHEFGHLFFLKFFYSKSKFKFGWNYYILYFTFYLDTSYSYLFPKYSRVAVYFGGIFLNSIFIILYTILFPKSVVYCNLLVSNLLINFIPIVRTDGYYAICALFNKYNKDKGKIKTYIYDVIRGIIMFGFIYFLTKIL